MNVKSLPKGTKVKYRGFPLNDSERFFIGVVESTHMDHDVLMVKLDWTSNPNSAYAGCSFPAYEFEILSSESELLALAMND